MAEAYEFLRAGWLSLKSLSGICREGHLRCGGLREGRHIAAPRRAQTTTRVFPDASLCQRTPTSSSAPPAPC